MSKPRRLNLRLSTASTEAIEQIRIQLQLPNRTAAVEQALETVASLLRGGRPVFLSDGNIAWKFTCKEIRP